MWQCVDPDGEVVSVEIVKNKNDCKRFSNFTWQNSPMNFDHVGMAYLSLFQVATFKGWIQIMKDATDSREVPSFFHSFITLIIYNNNNYNEIEINL